MPKTATAEKSNVTPLNQRSGLAEIQALIVAECDELRELLLEKNANYGNSVFDPLRIFSKASSEEQLLVRLDDKLSRIARGQLTLNEDTIKDLIGYLILLRVVRRRKRDE